jgi:hypothetical protein
VPSAGLAWRGSALIALTAPRGIVAAAVASLAARQMKAAGLAGATELEGLVYLTILATGVWSTLGAIALPRLLGFTADPARRRAILVGANPLSEILARRLAATGRTTLVIDSLSWRLDGFRAAGLQAVVGDARDAATYEEAGVEQDSLVVAATTNDELNLLVAELVHAEFGVEHPAVAIQRPPEELGRRSRGWVDVLGGRSVDVPEWIRAVEGGGCTELVVDPRSDATVATLHAAEREHPQGVLRLLGTLRGQPELDVGDDRLPQLDRLVLLVRDGSPLELLSPQRLAAETLSGAVPGVVAGASRGAGPNAPR